MGYFGIDLASSEWQGAVQRTSAAVGKPQIIGQYLPVYPTDRARLEAILMAGFSIIPIWNGDQNGSAIASSDPAVMVRQARLAAGEWSAAGLPKGAAIFLDVETGFFFNPIAAEQWIVAINGAGYTPGFYLNAYSGNNHANGYQQARAATKGIPCVYWTCQRELYAYASKKLTTLAKDANDAVVVPDYADECILWQYSENQLNGLVDYDVASTLDYFWNPAPKTPPKWTALRSFGLLPKPGHLKDNVQVVYVRKGGTGLDWFERVTVNGEVWARLQFCQFTGYAPLAYVKE